LIVSTSIADISALHAVGNGRTPKGVKLPPEANVLEANIVTFLDNSEKPISLIGLDSMVSSNLLEKSIKSSLSNLNHEVLIVATHTHHSPVLSIQMSKYLDYDVNVVAQTASCISTSINLNLRNAVYAEQFMLGSSVVKASVYRRKRTPSIQFKPRLGLGYEHAMAADSSVPIPQEIKVYVAKTADSVARFAIWSWPCHATSVPEPDCFSPDYPGIVREYLREVLDNSSLVVIYLPGFSGDIRPDSASYFTMNKARIRHPLAKLFRNRDRRFFKSICDQLKQGIDESLNSSFDVSSLREAIVRQITVPTREFFIGDAQVGVEICRVELAGLELLLIAAEVSAAYLKALQSAQGSECQQEIWYSGLYGQVFGYLPTEKQVAEGGYEPERSQSAYGISGKFLPQLDKRIIDLVTGVYDK